MNATSQRPVPAFKRSGRAVTLLTQTKPKAPSGSWWTSDSEGEGSAAAGKCREHSGCSANATCEQPAGGAGKRTFTVVQEAGGSRSPAARQARSHALVGKSSLQQESPSEELPTHSEGGGEEAEDAEPQAPG